jgi:hypothetical protein
MSTHTSAQTDESRKAAILEILREGPACASDVRGRLSVNQAVADRLLAELADAAEPTIRRTSIPTNDSTISFELIPVNPLD